MTEAQKERLALTGHPNTLETKVSSLIPSALLFPLSLVSQASPADVEPLGVESTEEENYQDHLATFVSGLQT